MVKVSRTFEIRAPPSDVWEFISDPDNRVRFLSPVKGYRKIDEGIYEWDINIPVIGSTISFRTHDIERIENERVEFKGSHRLVSLRGVHELEPLEDGTKTEAMILFEVKSKVPGVERAFRRIFSREIRKMAQVMMEELPND